jgi:hypothetical protein
MIHFEFNFRLLILDKTSTEAVAFAASMLVMALKWDNKYLTVFYHYYYIKNLSCVAYPLAVKPLNNSKFNCDLDL